MKLAWLVLGAMSLVACGGDDGKKARVACTDDGGCGGGMCFEQECYDACTELAPCAADELCVRKDRAGTEIDVCVVAADFAADEPPCVNAQPDCDAIVRGVCQFVGCHEGACLLANVTDGLPCNVPDGQVGTCQAGLCSQGGEPSTCDGPAGTWVGTFTRKDGGQASCVVDGQVTETLTITLTQGDDGTWSEDGSISNMPDEASGECPTVPWAFDSIAFDAATGALSMVLTSAKPKVCDTPTGSVEYPTRFGFDGTLSADCASLTGDLWIEPAKPCDGDNGRATMATVTLSKTAAATAVR